MKKGAFNVYLPNMGGGIRSFKVNKLDTDSDIRTKIEIYE